MRIHLQETSKSWVVADASTAYGGVAPCSLSAKKTKEFLIGKVWDQNLLQDALNVLQNDILLKEDTPGGMVEFQKSLTPSFFFKFFLWVSHQLDGIKELILASYLSAVHPVHRPTITGSQDYEIMKHRTSVGSPEVHLSAKLQVT
ncbi:xylitol dehydrogenase [Stylosanthes scabra]|uniref:Xylitol dehydrogenase n=1 Tax=Stylosanthes scabra TaxID=79078 RepID=A0ABU6Q9M6_9FABA|nr:xylitol dehydrogenase [Stylosanthes scabra]